jgi:hypothetical protein
VACANGSRPKASSPAFFVYDQAHINGFFGAVAGWFTTWAMGLPTTPQDTASF